MTREANVTIESCAKQIHAMESELAHLRRGLYLLDATPTTNVASDLLGCALSSLHFVSWMLDNPEDGTLDQAKGAIERDRPKPRKQRK